MPDFAPGLPDKKKISNVPIIKEPFLTNYVLHEHHAKRAGIHFDLRLNIRGIGYSWALRYFPSSPGDKRLAIRQPDHSLSYFTFRGEITDGYGAGKVYIKESGKVKILSSAPDYIKFVLIQGTSPREFFLKRVSKDWLLINFTRMRKATDPKGKESYKKAKDVDTLFKDKRYVFQPKIDGAHNILVLDKGKKPLVISHRVPKKGDSGLINHTHKFWKLKNEKTPAALAGHYRGEVYAVDTKNKPIPAEQLAGILNSKIDKSLETQNEKKIKLKMALFGVPSEKHKKLIDFLGEPFEGVETAYTEKEKRKLLDKIKSKKHPLTEEGVVAVDTKDGKYIKHRFRPDHDVYIRNIFEGAGKYKGIAAGGFDYSWTPSGKIVGKVGTGFTDKVRKDMWENSKEYVGRVAAVNSSRKLPSGALFQPSFERLHLDK